MKRVNLMAPVCRAETRTLENNHECIERNEKCGVIRERGKG